MDLFEKTKKFVEESFGEKKIHLERTGYWIKEIHPKADNAMIIAAISHDIERAFREEKDKHNVISNKQELRYHEEKGAEIMGNFLEKEGVDKDFIQRVKMLIRRHEEGGNDDQNIMKDGDSVSWLENNVDRWVQDMVPRKGKEVVKRKFDWMYNRITSEQARKIVEPWYREGIKKLGY